MTAALAVSETIYEVPTEDIFPATGIPNYRQRKGDAAKFAELVQSIRARGVLQPLVLRRNSIDVLELVFGHRRLAAALEAGLDVVPCVIREYDDETVRDARLIENNARENPHPLDQAEEYAAAVKRGHSPQAIAEKLGQSLRYVLQRLALHELCSAGQLALEQGYISLDVAVLVARLPSEKLQAAALRRVSANEGTDGLMLVEEARKEIEESVMLDLSEAPFKLDDAELVPAAGPCTTCTKRTGNQAELFADASKGDLCIDGDCHRSKLDALHKLRVKRAKVDGVEVVPAKKAADVLQGAWPSAQGELVKLDSFTQPDITVRKLFGDTLPPVTIAQDPKTGLTVELVPRAAFVAAQAAASRGKGKPAADPQRADAKAKAEREKEQLQAAVRHRTMVALVEAAENLETEPSLSLWRSLVGAAIHSLPPDVIKAVANRRGCPLTVEEPAESSKRGRGVRPQQLTPQERLQAYAHNLAIEKLNALLLELLLVRTAPSKWAEAHESYTDACDALGVDVVAIEKAVKAERKERAKSKADKGKPEHPAAGQVVHFIDPAGLSKTGAACGGKVGTSSGKGTLSDEPAKVTCKSCRRTAELGESEDT